MNLPSLLSLLLASIAFPFGDLYVDQAAPNCATGTGTLVDPVCTVEEAITLASPGDTIHIAPGIYFGQLTLPFDLELIGTSGQSATILDGQDLGSVLTIPAAVSGTVDGLTLRRGKAFSAGGGVLVEGNLTLRNSTVSDNKTTWIFSGGGGGIAALAGGSTVVIEQCSILDNFGAFAGGGIDVSHCDLSITDSTISGNQVDSSGSSGGGVSANLSLVVITNTTISANFSGNGAGLAIGNSLSGSGLWNSTVAENFTCYSSIVAFGGSFELGGSLVSKEVNYYGNPVISGTLISAGHNFIDAGGAGVVDGVNGDQVGTRLNPLDPGLGPLQDNGGPTWTHAPLPGSLVIDAGNPLSTTLFDQRGVSRPQGVANDIGAVEFTGQPNTFCNGDGGDQLGCSNCPCGNNSALGTPGGCLNSAGTSAKLIAYGDASVSLPAGSANDLGFSLTGALPSVFAVLNSGDAVAPLGAANPCFGMQSGVQALAFDGLRCAALNTRRHGCRATTSDGNVSVLNGAWGGAGSPLVGIAAMSGFNSGQTRFFQVVHRDDAQLSCMRGLNTSQAVEIQFTP